MNKPQKAGGHAAHTQDAGDSGMPGTMRQPIKITMLGAGSGFTPRLANDVMRIPGNSGGTIALVDIDRERLTTMHKLLVKLAKQLGKARQWKIIASTNRREVMGASDYLVNCIEVSGTGCVHFDNDIPLKYGVDQCIGDTIGPGGLFKALRTIPVWLAVLQDAERLCPNAIVLNYTNPMSMMCLAAGRTSQMSIVGLCHSVQGTSHLLAQYAGVPYEEMTWDCAGVNHLAWFTKLEHNGQSLYPKLHAKFAKEIAAGIQEATAGKTSHDARDTNDGTTWQQGDLVRKDMCLHFGAFITESSGHLSEYLPYYRKSDAGRQLLRVRYEGGSRFYATNWPHWRQAADRNRLAMLRGTTPMDWNRSWEYASWIIEAHQKAQPFRIYGNVMNNDGSVAGSALISNLPADGCVEVACLVDGTGVHPVRYGKLPAQMAAICDWNMRMFDLAATAAIERSKEAAIHALLLDPYTAAVCTPAQIKQMTLELFQAEKQFLPGYK